MRAALLELLAASDGGCTDALLQAHGFALDLMVGLVRAGLATAKGRTDVCRPTRGRDHAGADRLVELRHRAAKEMLRSRSILLSIACPMGLPSSVISRSTLAF
jgi:hypothetical protein